MDKPLGDCTLRDYFASSALQGLLNFPHGRAGEGMVKAAYELADLMLVERDRQPEPEPAPEAEPAP